jgi:hypothetical protein
MDPDSFKSDKKEKNKDTNIDPGNFLQSFGIRRTIRSRNEVDWILLGNRYNFLFHIGIVFWLVLFIEARK